LAASSADWPATDWWRDYGDPQLDGLITGALAGAPGLKEAQARLHRAVAGTAAARAAGLLSLTASGGVADAKQSHYQGFPPEFVTDPGITIEIGAEVSALHGTDHLEAVTVRDVKTGATREVKTRALFIMVGAAPNTGWLSDLVKLDEKGYVLTGSGPESASSPFATSMPGIFAVFDVRAGSVKRVDSSVGERSVVISKVWEHVNG
jgi:thioredoxin reductase (NADPH)